MQVSRLLPFPNKPIGQFQEKTPGFRQVARLHTIYEPGVRLYLSRFAVACKTLPGCSLACVRLSSLEIPVDGSTADSKDFRYFIDG